MIDPTLTTLVRDALEGTRAVREIKMFGGIGFMVNGNMLVAASSRGLLVRVGKENQDDALAKPNASLMVMKGRTMTGYIRVADGTLDARVVKSWVNMALEFVQTLPAKTPKGKAALKRKAAKKSRN